MRAKYASATGKAFIADVKDDVASVKVSIAQAKYNFADVKDDVASATTGNAHVKFASRARKLAMQTQNPSMQV